MAILSILGCFFLMLIIAGLLASTAFCCAHRVWPAALASLILAGVAVLGLGEQFGEVEAQYQQVIAQQP